MATVEPKIHGHSQRCVELFRRCATDDALGRWQCVEVGQSDFNLWVHGLNALSLGKASLDYRVRDRKDLIDLITNLLDGLAECLETALEQVSSVDTTSRLPFASIIFEDLEFDIKAILVQLSKIHIAIRRSGNKLRYSKADATLQDALNTKEFQEWENDMRNFISLGFGNEDFLTNMRKTPELRSKPLNSVHERLIYANLLRRNRILYATRNIRSSLHSKKYTPLEVQNVETVNPVQTDHQHQQDAIIKQSTSVISKKPETETEMHSISKRTATELGSTFQFESAPSQRPSTVITRATQTGRNQDYPRWPQISGSAGDRPCPYCAEPLSREYTTNNDRWRGHLIRDISPYICFIADCEGPEEMFTTTDDLTKHLRTFHGVIRWICEYCEGRMTIFETANEWMWHVKHDHFPETTFSLLKPLEDHSKRSMIPLVECPVCDFRTANVSLDLDEHIARHLHEFAIRALPWGISGVAADDDTGDPQLSSRSLDTSQLSGSSDLVPAEIIARELGLAVAGSFSSIKDQYRDTQMVRVSSSEDVQTHRPDVPVPNERVRRSRPNSFHAGYDRELEVEGVPETYDFKWTFSIYKKDYNIETDSFLAPMITRVRNLRNVPIAMNYTGQLSELDTLEETLLPDMHNIRRKAFVLSGLGEMGKTPLAAEFVQRHHAKFGAVLWLDSSSKDLLKSTFVEHVDRLSGDYASVAYKLVATPRERLVSWLSHTSNNRWLIVFDDVSPDGSNSLTQDIEMYIPRANHGSILLTVRSTGLDGLEAYQELKESYNDTAKGTLKSYSGKKYVGIEAVQLDKRVGGHPLATSLACTYIQEKGINTQQYNQIFEERWDGLLHTGNLTKLDQNGAVRITFEIFWEAYLAIDKHAALLLMLWGYLDCNDLWFGIFEWMTSEAYIKSKQLGNLIIDGFCFHRVMHLLQKFSLVEVSASIDGYSIDPFIHQLIRNRSDHQTQFKMATSAVIIVGNAIPDGTGSEYATIRQRLLPHALTSLKWTVTKARDLVVAVLDFETMEAVLDAFYRIVYANDSLDLVDEAEGLLNFMFLGGRYTIGESNASVFDTMEKFSTLYQDRGNFQGARYILQMMLLLQRKLFGAENVLFSRTLDGINRLRKEQGER